MHESPSRSYLQLIDWSIVFDTHLKKRPSKRLYGFWIWLGGIMTATGIVKALSLSSPSLAEISQSSRSESMTHVLLSFLPIPALIVGGFVLALVACSRRHKHYYMTVSGLKYEAVGDNAFRTYADVEYHGGEGKLYVPPDRWRSLRIGESMPVDEFAHALV